MAKETTPKATKKAITKKEGEQNKVEIFKVFDKKSNRPRILTQEEIDIYPTRYQLREV
jgi:hypothetical protein